MELYHIKDMPLSSDSEKRKTQERLLRGEESLNVLGIGRDKVYTQVGNFKCKPDYCYRCTREDEVNAC